MQKSISWICNASKNDFIVEVSNLKPTKKVQQNCITLVHVYLIYEPISLALTPYSLVRSGGATNTIFIVFDLTRPGMELVIYRTQGEHANHYTMDAVKVLLISRVERHVYPWTVVSVI
jgi:hypothetical protein